MVFNQLVSQSFPEFRHTVTLPAREVGLSKEAVDLCNGQEKSKHMIRRMLHSSHDFNTNRTVSLCIVIIDGMAFLEVVVYHLRIHKCFHLASTTLLPVTLCFFEPFPTICPIG